VTQTPQQLESPWPHRWAVALVCATFPMIWIGGLVTTYGAGMAVPDWPSTYGYNLFLYPWQTWIYGPWKLFIEHGHRLLGTVVGVLTISFLLSTWLCQKKRSLRWLGFAALAGVLLQGVLGGMRVLANQVLLAQIHGCVGPAFFAVTVALAVVTSRRWQQAVSEPSQLLATIQRLSLVITFLAMLQIVVGSQLRHLSAAVRPGEFRMVLFFHLFVAAGLWAHIFMLAGRVWRSCRQEAWIARPTWSLALLVVLQISLGLGTWVLKYGFPEWLGGYDFAARFRPTADAPWQMVVTTAHVAIGSMLLVTSLMLTLRTRRLGGSDTSAKMRETPRPFVQRTLAMEAAR
jgi:cytochrome c oxidase assembly protein subunit 15